MTEAMSAIAMLSSMVMESGQRWGDCATEWQWADAQAFIAGVVRFHFWLRARGMSKTGDAGAILLALLLCEAPARSRSYAYAADADQAALLLDSIIGFVERTGLDRLVVIGSRSIACRASGATLSIESSDAASSFGTRPWLVVLDEVAQWPDVARYNTLWASVISGLGKVRGSRLLVMTSAGSPAHPSYKRWQRAESSRHWRASLVPGPCPWWTPEDVAAAEESLTPAEAQRYIYCQWCESDDALATTDDVLACVGDFTSREPKRGVSYVMSLDVGLRRDSTVVTVGHVESGPDGRRVVIDRLLRWTGTRAAPVSLGAVETSILACWREFHAPTLHFDYHQAAQLTQRLTAAGVNTQEFGFTVAGVNKLARTLFGCLRDRSILLPNIPELLSELSSVRLVETGPNLLRLDHKSGSHDDMAVACAITAAALLDEPSHGPLRLLTAAGMRFDTGSMLPKRPAMKRIGKFNVPMDRYRAPGSW